MTERGSGHQRRIWTFLFAVAVVLGAVGAGSRGLSSPRSAGVKASEAGPPKARHLPDDLVGASDAKYAFLGGLAPGSREAQERQRQSVQQLEIPLEVKTCRTGIVLRLVPAGSFTMGTPKTEQDAMLKVGVVHAIMEGDSEHRVTLTKAFYCGKFEVTQGQWEQVMESDPSYFRNAGKDAPVEQVSWDDCQVFLKKLCQMEGVAEGTYRLLTEAEWEYACRAGTQKALYGGDLVIKGFNNAPALDPIAWYAGNSRVDYEGAVDVSGRPEKQYDHKGAGTHPVGVKGANGFGLYDMIGNVMEWCQDKGGEYPSATGPLGHPGPALAGTDPRGLASGDDRVIRGACWVSSAGDCRSAVRYWSVPDNRGKGLGFRLARTAPSYP